MELAPITHDVIEGAVVEAFYTLICARLGMTDDAISRIERLLTTPFAVDYDDASITLSDLRQRWEWDPLRNDPRFQKIYRQSCTEHDLQIGGLVSPKDNGRNSAVLRRKNAFRRAAENNTPAACAPQNFAKTPPLQMNAS